MIPHLPCRTRLPAPALAAALLALLAASPALAEEAPCLLEPNRKATLAAQMDARVVAVTVDEGDRFPQGAELVRFDCALEEAELRREEASVSAASQRLTIHRRMQKLDSISELEVATSQAALEKALADQGIARVHKARCTIAAPFAGVVSKRHIHPHDSSSFGDPLLEIMDDSRLKVRIYVPAAWRQWLRPGVPFQVRIADEPHPFPATVTVLGAHVDPASQNMLVRGVVDDPHAPLAPGLGGMAIFTPAGTDGGPATP